VATDLIAAQQVVVVSAAAMTVRLHIARPAIIEKATIRCSLIARQKHLVHGVLPNRGGVLERFRKEARRRRVGYQTLTNEVLAQHVRKDVA
jgi:sugar (pentulose or hexulose) kinase